MYAPLVTKVIKRPSVNESGKDIERKVTICKLTAAQLKEAAVARQSELSEMMERMTETQLSKLRDGAIKAAEEKELTPEQEWDRIFSSYSRDTVLKYAVKSIDPLPKGVTKEAVLLGIDEESAQDIFEQTLRLSVVLKRKAEDQRKNA